MNVIILIFTLRLLCNNIYTIVLGFQVQVWVPSEWKEGADFWRLTAIVVPARFGHETGGGSRGLLPQRWGPAAGMLPSLHPWEGSEEGGTGSSLLSQSSPSTLPRVHQLGVSLRQLWVSILQGTLLGKSLANKCRQRFSPTTLYVMNVLSSAGELLHLW